MSQITKISPDSGNNVQNELDTEAGNKGTILIE
jgi:hypothetical protein